MGEVDDDMKGRHHTPEQIVHKLREADRLLGEGQLMVQVCNYPGVTGRRITVGGIRIRRWMGMAG